MFDMKQKEVRGKSTAQFIQHIEPLLTKVTKDATNPIEYTDEAP